MSGFSCSYASGLTYRLRFASKEQRDAGLERAKQVVNKGNAPLFVLTAKGAVRRALERPLLCFLQQAAVVRFGKTQRVQGELRWPRNIKQNAWQVGFSGQVVCQGRLEKGVMRITLRLKFDLEGQSVDGSRVSELLKQEAGRFDPFPWGVAVATQASIAPL